jgi:hypothetical protein
MASIFYIGNIFLETIPQSLLSREELISLVDSTPDLCRGQTSSVQLSYLQLLLGDENNCVVYIEEAGVIKGITVFMVVHDVIHLYVICATKGFGSILLEKVKQIGRQLGLKTISLVSKKETVGFYTKNGFNIVSNTSEIIYNLEYNLTGGRRQHKKGKSKSKTTRKRKHDTRRKNKLK